MSQKIKNCKKNNMIRIYNIYEVLLIIYFVCVCVCVCSYERSTTCKPTHVTLLYTGELRLRRKSLWYKLQYRIVRRKVEVISVFVKGHDLYLATSFQKCIQQNARLAHQL